MQHKTDDLFSDPTVVFFDGSFEESGELTPGGRAVAAVHIPGYAPRWDLDSVTDKLTPLAVETAMRISDSLTDAM